MNGSHVKRGCMYNARNGPRSIIARWERLRCISTERVIGTRYHIILDMDQLRLQENFYLRNNYLQSTN